MKVNSIDFEIKQKNSKGSQTDSNLMKLNSKWIKDDLELNLNDPKEFQKNLIELKVNKTEFNKH